MQDYYKEMVNAQDQLGYLGVSIIGIFLAEYKGLYAGHRYMWNTDHIHHIAKFINERLIRFNIILEEEVLQVNNEATEQGEILTYLVRDVTYVIRNPFI